MSPRHLAQLESCSSCRVYTDNVTGTSPEREMNSALTLTMCERTNTFISDLPSPKERNISELDAMAAVRPNKIEYSAHIGRR